MRLLANLAVFVSLTLHGAAEDAAPVARDFSLPSARDNRLLRLSDHPGKVVLIHWWRSSCSFCRKGDPKLVALEKELRDKGLVVFGISDDTADTVAAIPDYLKNLEITWPVALNDQGEFIRDVLPKGKGETPGNYLVSRTGELTWLGLDRTPEDWQKLVEAVKRALAEPAPAAAAIVPRVPEAAPALSLPTLDGKTLTLKDFAGKPLVINFFNADSSDWAGAVIATLHKDYSEKGLQVVGINLFDSDDDARKCAEKHGAKYPILRGDEATQTAWIGEAKGWATFFVDAEGRIVKKITNSIENGLEAVVFRRYAEILLAK
ncbi:MAG: TlpA disulfide reductase family protein [Planctomycetota bacterium]